MADCLEGVAKPASLGLPSIEVQRSDNLELVADDRACPFAELEILFEKLIIGGCHRGFSGAEFWRLRRSERE